MEYKNYEKAKRLCNAKKQIDIIQKALSFNSETNEYPRISVHANTNVVDDPECDGEKALSYPYIPEDIYSVIIGSLISTLDTESKKIDEQIKDL